MRTRNIAVALALALQVATGSSVAAEVLVTALDDGAGICPSANACTLRAAIAAAEADDTVRFDPILLFPATVTLQSTELQVDKNLRIEGPGADRLAIAAATGQRVLTLQQGTLAVTGLTLQGGRVQGLPHMPNFGGTGGTAEGGCVLTAAGTSLLLDHVALQDCQAIGGDGGNGMDAIAGGALPGGDGGAGGAGQGGAIAAGGMLTLLHSSVRQSLAVGGKGGTGGSGGANLIFVSGGGHGGRGGDATGGAIYVAGSGALLLRNATLLGDGLAGGEGGHGGSAGVSMMGSVGTGGSGGDAGALRGGQLHVGAGAELADLEFVSAGPAEMLAGAAGAAGFGNNALPGQAAARSAEVVGADAALRARHVLLLGRDAVPDCDGATLTTSGSGIDSDDSCGVLPLQGSFDNNIDTGSVEERGLAVMRLRSGSPVIDSAADCVGLDTLPVTLDQSGRARPLDGDQNGTTACDPGAIEFDPHVFRDGFEG